MRGLLGEPADSVSWLTEPLGGFGSRLGAVLYRIPAAIRRAGPWSGGDPSASDARVRTLLAAWPAWVPLTMEFQDASWHVDETFATLSEAGAVLCTTDLPGGDGPPTIRRTGPFLYLRLRRETYDDRDLEAWVRRVLPFLDAGDDVFTFFRHDTDGHAGQLAMEFARRVAARRGAANGAA